MSDSRVEVAKVRPKGQDDRRWTNSMKLSSGRQPRYPQESSQSWGSESTRGPPPVGRGPGPCHRSPTRSPCRDQACSDRDRARGPATAEVTATVPTLLAVSSSVVRHLERLVALGYLVSSQRRWTSGKRAKLYRLAGRKCVIDQKLRLRQRRPDVVREKHGMT